VATASIATQFAEQWLNFRAKIYRPTVAKPLHFNGNLQQLASMFYCYNGFPITGRLHVTPDIDNRNCWVGRRVNGLPRNI
jgi:hypothetical protein